MRETTSMQGVRTPRNASQHRQITDQPSKGVAPTLSIRRHGAIMTSRRRHIATDAYTIAEEGCDDLFVCFGCGDAR
jgi:hypothetical protein